MFIALNGNAYAREPFHLLFALMFILVTIRDVIRIEPSKFSKEHVTVGAYCRLGHSPRRR